MHEIFFFWLRTDFAYALLNKIGIKIYKFNFKKIKTWVQIEKLASVNEEKLVEK